MSEDKLVDPFNPPEVSQEGMAGIPDPDQILDDGQTIFDKHVAGNNVVVGDGNIDDIKPKSLFGPELFDELFNRTGNNLNKAYVEEVEASMEDTNLNPNPMDEISLESRTIDNSLVQIESLNHIHLQLLELGGVNKDLVYSAESISDGVISKTSNLNQFTHNLSQEGYVVSLESIGSTVLEMIKNVIKRILAGLKRLKDFIKGLFKQNENTFTDPDLLLKKRKDLIDMAVRLDSSFGRVAVSKSFGTNDPIALQTSTAREYVMAKIDDETLKSLRRHFTYSYYAICTNNILTNHVKKIKGVLDDQLKSIVDDTTKLTNTPIESWRDVKTDNVFIGLDSFTKEVNVHGNDKTPIEQLSDYQNALTEKYKRIVNVPVTLKEFTKACVYIDPFSDWEKEQKQIQDDLDRSEKSIAKLADKIDKLNTDGKYSVEVTQLKLINQRISVCVQLIAILNNHRSRYVSYHAKLSTVLRIIDIKLKAVLIKNRLT